MRSQEVLQSDGAAGCQASSEGRLSEPTIGNWDFPDRREHLCLHSRQSRVLRLWCGGRQTILPSLWHPMEGTPVKLED